MTYNGVDTYIVGIGTVRECIDCSCLVPGGPTRCIRCAKEGPPGDSKEGEMNATTIEFYKRCNENQFQLIEILREKIANHKVEAKALHLQVKNLRWHIDHQGIRIKSLESELSSLRMVELDLSMTEEEYKVYEEGMKVLNSEGEMNEEDIKTINSCHCGCPSHQEVQEIALNVMEEAFRGILAR